MPSPGNRGGGNTDNEMLKFCVAIAAACLPSAAQAFAASAVNLDTEPRTLIVTEGGSKTELALGCRRDGGILPGRLLRDHAEWRPRGADRLRNDRDFRRRRQDQVTAQPT